jgi:hypothetical protein
VAHDECRQIATGFKNVGNHTAPSSSWDVDAMRSMQ